MGRKARNRERERMEDLARKYENEAASIAVHQRRQFRDRYQPLLVRERDRLLNQESPAGLFRGRANADLAQQFADADTGLLGLRNPAATHARSSAMAEQAGKANAAALGAWNRSASDVIAGGRNQAMSAAGGLADAARISGSAAASTAMARLRMKQDKQNALFGMGRNLLGAGLGNYIASGKFFDFGHGSPGANRAAALGRIFL